MSKKKCPEFENHERWLISYADMLTLLFAVFVVLYSFAKSDKKEEDDKLADSLKEGFNQPFDDIPGFLEKMDPINWDMFENIKGLKKESKDAIILQNDMDKLNFRLEERLYGPEKFRKSTNNKIISVYKSENGFNIRIIAKYFFKSGSYKISKYEYLDIIAEFLKELDKKIIIEGHTDSLKPKNMDNWTLSSLRASSFADFLIRKGFPKTHISIAGYADLKPIGYNGSEEGRKLNRRIEIKIPYDEFNIH